MSQFAKQISHISILIDGTGKSTVIIICCGGINPKLGLRSGHAIHQTLAISGKPL